MGERDLKLTGLVTTLSDGQESISWWAEDNEAGQSYPLEENELWFLAESPDIRHRLHMPEPGPERSITAREPLWIPPRFRTEGSIAGAIEAPTPTTESLQLYLDVDFQPVSLPPPEKGGGEVYRAEMGMGMYQSIHVREDLRQTITLSLTLQLKLEQSLLVLQSIGLESARDGIFGDIAPPQYYDILKIILKMAEAGEPSEYLKFADEATKGLEKITDHFFRFKAACKLFEELFFHPALKNAAVQFLRNELNNALAEAASTSDKFMATLIAASSFASAGGDVRLVHEMVERSLGLARSADGLEWSSSDRANFITAVKYLAKNGEGDAVNGWLGELFGPIVLEEATEEVPDEAAETPSEPPQAVPQGPRFTQEQAQLLERVIITNLMGRLYALAPQSEATFETLLRLATDVGWEGIAAHAYHLLSRNQEWLARLEPALPHFRSGYYRTKARFEVLLAKLIRTPVDGTLRRQIAGLLDDARGMLDIEGLDEETTGYERAWLALVHDKYHDITGAVSDYTPPDESALAFLEGVPIGIDITRAMNSSSVIQSYASAVATDLLRPPSNETTAADDAPRTDEVETVEEVEAEDDREYAFPLGIFYPEIESNMGKRVEVARVLFHTVGLARFDTHQTLEAEALKARLLELDLTAGPRAVIDVIQATYVPLEVVDDILKGRPYFWRLGRIFSLVNTNTTYKNEDEIAENIAKEISRFIKAAETEERVPNIDVIKDASYLAEAFYGKRGLTNHALKLITHARRRIKLITEKVKELEEFESPSDERADELASWKHLKSVALGYVYAFEDNPQSEIGEYETNRIKQLSKLGSPETAAPAAFLRARFLFGFKRDFIYGQWIERYIDEGLSYLAAIEDVSARLELVREFLASLSAEFVKYYNLGPQMMATIGDKNVSFEYEIDKAKQARRPADPNWFSLENLAAMLNSGAIGSYEVARIFTNKEINKLVQKGLIGDDKIALLYATQIVIGQSNQNAAKWLLDKLTSYEAGADIPQGIALLFKSLVFQGNERVFQYALGRVRAALLRTGALITTDKDFISAIIGSDKFPPKLADDFVRNSDIPMDARAWLFEQMVDAGRYGRDIVGSFSRYKSRGQTERFLNLFNLIRSHMPEVSISQALLDKIELDPRAGEGGGVEKIIVEWGGFLDDFKALDFVERIKALASNEVLCQLYYYRNIGVTRFRNGPYYSYDEFQRDIKVLASQNTVYDHRPMQSFETALEKHHPTDSAQRQEALVSLSGHTELSGTDRDIIERIILSNGPLSEDDLCELKRIQKEVFPSVIGILPSNRQRIFNLYNGLPPVTSSSAGLNADGEFIIEYSPGQPGLFKNSLRSGRSEAKFGQQFTSLANIIRANYLLKKLPAGNDVSGLIANNSDPNTFYEKLVNTYIETTVEGDAKAKRTARKKLLEEVERYMNETALPKLVTENWLFNVASLHMSMNPLFRLGLKKPRFSDIEPNLSSLGILAVEDNTPVRKALAERLGAGAQNRDRKVSNEVELTAAIIGIDPVLKESYLSHVGGEMDIIMAERRALITLDELVGARKQLRARYVPRGDILTFLQIGNFRPCCIATNGMHYKDTVPYFFKDLMTGAFAIYDTETNEGLGHMVGHFGLSGKDLHPVFLLNGMYMRVPNRSVEIDDANLAVVDVFAQDAGIDEIRHGMAIYPDLSQGPPNGYTKSTATVVRLQVINDTDGKPVPLYNDLGINKTTVNQPQQTTHYSHKVEAAPKHVGPGPVDKKKGGGGTGGYGGPSGAVEGGGGEAPIASPAGENADLAPTIVFTSIVGYEGDQAAAELSPAARAQLLQGSGAPAFMTGAAIYTGAPAGTTAPIFIQTSVIP